MTEKCPPVEFMDVSPFCCILYCKLFDPEPVDWLSVHYSSVWMLEDVFGLKPLSSTGNRHWLEPRLPPTVAQWNSDEGWDNSCVDPVTNPTPTIHHHPFTLSDHQPQQVGQHTPWRLIQTSVYNVGFEAATFCCTNWNGISHNLWGFSFIGQIWPKIYSETRICTASNPLENAKDLQKQLKAT